MAMSPTQRQMDLMRFIAGWVEAHGASPTVAEMAAGLQMTNRGEAHQLLRGLAERGLVRLANGRRRGLAVQVLPAIPRGPQGEPLHVVEGNW